ncbi:hypothetical protein HYT95_01510 [Candidatus Peregrinibacteria bacterium]|nr:hypothetical protein [Candidatus Peregrinibacteria bacterium]
MIAAVLLLILSSPASAQYYNPSYSWNYQAYPGGGSYSYSVSNGFETLSVSQSMGYGSAYYSHSYSGPYGNYSWYRNNSYPVYYYPTYYYPRHSHYPLYQGRVYLPYRIR